MKDYIKKQAEKYAKHKSSADVFKQSHITDFTAGFEEATELMPKLLEFYSDNFRRTDQDFDKVVTKFFDKLNK